jgi:predicted dehydrogenase
LFLHTPLHHLLYDLLSFATSIREPKQQFESPPLGKAASKLRRLLLILWRVEMRHSSSQSRIRYAVVGLGHIAQVAVLPAFKHASNCELLALVSGDATKLSKLGRKYSLEHLYSYKDYGRVLSNVDAVYLAVPNHLHREFAERAAAAGVHVLCEKPMAVTEDDCRAMIAASLRNRVKLMIAYRLHFEAGNLHAIELARSGRLGTLRIFSSDFCQQVVAHNVRVTEVPEKGGGPVYDMGVYCINAARYLFRAEPSEIFATSARNHEERFQLVDEMVSVTMRFPQQRLATFTCSFGAAEVSRYWLIGTKGTLLADPAYEYAGNIRQQVVIGGKTKIHRFPKRDQFAAELIYFADCILKNKDPEPSGTEGLMDVRIVQAVYESIRSRRPVLLGETISKKRPVMSQQIHRPAHTEPEIVRGHRPAREVA